MENKGLLFTFHQSLNAYDVRKYCYCQACISAADLTLKIITHFGEYTGYHVKQFSKLIGKDVIVVHQLLKNDIQNHEYWLVTRDLPGADPPSGLAEWMKWNRGSRKTDNGEVVYHYTPLTAYSYQSDNIEFWEKEVENGRTFHYILQELEGNQTGLTLEVYFSRDADTESESGDNEIAKLRGELERSMETLATISKD